MGQLIQLENFARLKPYAGMFAEGLAITVLLALFTVLIGFILALLLALMRMSNFRPFRALGLNRGRPPAGRWISTDAEQIQSLEFYCHRLCGGHPLYPHDGADPDYLSRCFFCHSAAKI